MKANEIQIGDWVLLWNKPQRVNYINLDDGERIGTDKQYLAQIAEAFEPIPLTAEILEKNGFSKTTEAEFNYYQMPDDCFEIHINNVGCAYIVDVIIRYVHQLQHALRLCGITHEISL